MKKKLLLLVTLIGLLFSNQVFAQSDLDVLNNTSCTYTIIVQQWNWVTCTASAITTYTSFPGPIATFAGANPADFVFKANASDGCGSSNSVWDYSWCTPNVNTWSVIPASACCPSANLTFLKPTAAVNAMLQIN